MQHKMKVCKVVFFFSFAVTKNYSHKTQKMKKNVILFMILSLVMMFTACKKDTSLTNVKLDPTEQKILNFKEKMQNPNKSDETISIDSAVWYIEAALNYTYCIIPEEEVGNGLDFITKNESLTFEINISDGFVTIQDVTNSYNQIESEISGLLEGINYDKKFIYLIDVEYEDTNKLNVIYTLKYKENSNKSLWDITESWYPIGWWEVKSYHHGGNCSQTDLNHDLITDIEKWISRNRPVYGGVYYTDNHNEGWFYSYAPEEMDIYEGSPYQNLYSGSSPQVEMYTSIEHIWAISPNIYPDLVQIECVTPERGNFYAAETNQGLDKVGKKIASNRHVVSWNVYGELVCRLHGDDDDNNEWWVKHKMTVYSAIPHKKEINQN